MADIAIFRINYKSDFILTLNSDAGWMTPFCIKFWTGAPSQAYFAGYDDTTYTHCAPVEGDPTKLVVQFDDHHLPVGDLTFQIGYHFTVADFPTSVEDEVLNQASVIIEQDGEPAQVMLDFNGETAPEIEFSLPAYANEAQRITNEQARIEAEQQRIANEDARIQAEETRQQNEQQRIAHETNRINEFATLKSQSQAATSAANAAATLANEKAQLAADKAALAQAAATLANDKAQLAADKAALAQAAATLANDKAALAQQKAAYAQTQGDYAKAQGDYAKAQGDTAQADHERAEADHATAASDHSRAESDHTTAASDHSRAETDHTTAASDHSRAETDHTTAASDHSRAESDHTTAAADHSRAESDHTTAAADHETAASDHTRAESDHAAVEVYVDSLGAFDISSYHATGGVLAKYADLSAALGTDGANIPEGIRKGGMSVKFVQSSDNKYVQYFLTKDEWSASMGDWEKMNLEEEVSQLSQEMDNNFGVDYTSSLLANKKIVIPANIGDITNITPQNQSGFNCICVPAKNMEVFKFTGQGGKGPRLWAILDKDYKLVSVASEDAWLTDYVLLVHNDGFVVYNSSIMEGNYFKSYGTLFQNTINVTVEYPLEGQYYTLATAIAAIPIERRRVCQTIIFRTESGLVSMYSYKSQLTEDVYWNDTSRWVKWLQDADISAINEAITTLLSDKQKAQEYENGKVLTDALISDKCYRIGSASIGDTISLTPDSQSGIACLLYECKDGDTFLVKGYGASGPRLWGFLDTDAKLLSMCNTAYYQTQDEGIYLSAEKDGYLIINTQMNYANNLVKLLGHNPDNFIKKSKWLAMGDSITEGYYSYGEGQYAITHDCWANYVKFIKGYNLINKGTGGQGYAHGPSCARIAVDTLIAQNAFDGVNLVTLAYGVNDWKYNETLGSMDDEVSASAMNIIPSMRYVIERLMAANPKMKIIVIMPINCCAYGEKANNWGIGFAFTNNGTLQQIYESFVGVCNYYGVQYIDMLHHSSINRENVESLLLDGVHPSMDGHKLMARELAEKITCY